MIHDSQHPSARELKTAMIVELDRHADMIVADKGGIQGRILAPLSKHELHLVRQFIRSFPPHNEPDHG